MLKLMKYGTLISLAVATLTSAAAVDDACKCEATWIDDSGACADVPIEQKACPTIGELRRCNPLATIRQCQPTKAACNGLYKDSSMFQYCNIQDQRKRDVLNKIKKGEDQKCMIAKHNTKSNDTEVYDLTVLEKKSTPDDESANWLYSNWHSEKRDKEGHDSKDYWINVCAPLANLYTGTDPNIAVKESDLSSSNDGQHVLGRFNGSSLVSMHNDDLRIILPNGDAAQHQVEGVCTTRKTVILFFCNEGLGEPNFVDEFQTCEYIFAWNSCAACPLGHKWRDTNCGPGTEATESTFPFVTSFKAMSPGSVVMIVITICLSVYLIGGCMYNRFVTGARGLDQFPNSAFWGSMCASISSGPSACCSMLLGRRGLSNVSFQTQYEYNDLKNNLDIDDVDDDAESQ